MDKTQLHMKNKSLQSNCKLNIQCQHHLSNKSLHSMLLKHNRCALNNTALVEQGTSQKSLCMKKSSFGNPPQCYKWSKTVLHLARNIATNNCRQCTQCCRKNRNMIPHLISVCNCKNSKQKTATCTPHNSHRSHMFGRRRKQKSCSSDHLCMPRKSNRCLCGMCLLLLHDTFHLSAKSMSTPRTSR